MKSKLLLIILSVGVLGGVVYKFVLPRFLDSQNKKTTIIETVKNLIPVKTEETNTSSEISGEISLLPTDLNLFDWSDVYGDGTKPEVKYYYAGTFNSGEFKGYKRIVAVQEAIGPGGPSAYIFVTNDDKTYTVSGDPQDSIKYPDNTDSRNPFFGTIKTKVTNVAKLDTIHPDIITLDSNFLLLKGTVPTDSVSTGKSDPNGYITYSNILVTDFSKNQKLNFDSADLTLYGSNLSKNPEVQNLPSKEKVIAQIKDTYVSGTTKVFVVDSAGLAVGYTLATAQNLQIYKADKSEYPAQPNLRFNKSQLVTTSNTYNKYDIAAPGACGMGYETKVIKGVSDSDITQIGTLNGLPIYTLKNKTHPLYTLAYNQKIDSFDSDFFNSANPGVTKPSLAKYVEKNPLLFLKDFWGRLVALGEYDYILPGGCGKPVIYLYPTEPTDINIKFLTDINLTTQIPTYHDGWSVQAFPNGKIVDLQPQYTNCKTINTNHSGSEYAKEACKKNSYPYIYWSGNVKYKSYPNINGGWVITKEDLSKFLDTKLAEIGLNEKEQNDMKTFWLPRMLNENAPYYKISFLQTSDMNALAPMQINPKPDTLFRIFLDYKALASKPSEEVLPQSLSTLVRKGFTVVEWGGLLK